MQSAGARQRKPHTRYGRASMFDPKPNELEIETVFLLLAGENYSDLAIKFSCTRNAFGNRVARMRELFGVATTPELMGLFIARGWVALPTYEGAQACLRSACESCPIAAARLVQLPQA